MASKSLLCIAGMGVFISLAFASELAAQHGNETVQSSPSDAVVTVPDGTPLTLRLGNRLSSATAKVGDPVQFKVAYPVLVHGLAFVPDETPVSGTIVRVRHGGHFGKNGEFDIAIKDIALPVEMSVSVRQTLESQPPPRHDHNRRKATADVAQAIVESVPFFGITLPIMAVAWGFDKGTERVYPAGNFITVYINGPIALDRNAFATLSLKTPAAQIFFKNDDCLNDFLDCESVSLFLGKYFLVGELRRFLRVDLKPGTYSFSTDKTEESLQLDLLPNHQYWVERKQKMLIADDAGHHQDEIDNFESYRWTTNRYLVDEILPSSR